MPRYRTTSTWRHEKSFRYVRPPEEVELTEEQAAKLIEAGCLDPNPLDEPETDTEPGANVDEQDEESGDSKELGDYAYPKPVGGGWYELPDGERVRGKRAAIDAMAGE